MISAGLALSLLLAVQGAQEPRTPAQQPSGVIDRHPNTSLEDLRTYEVRDLLNCIEPGTSAADGEGPVAEARTLARAKAVTFLTEFITQNVQPPLSGPQQSIRITPNGTLVLHATPEQHDWVQALLLRNGSREQMVLGQTTWIEGPKGAFQRMGIAAGATPTVLELKDLERFLALRKSEPEFYVITSPRLVIFPLSTSAVTVGEFIAFVKSYKLETVQPGDVKLPVPEIAHEFQGLELVARTVLLDSQRVVLDLTASNSVVNRPIPTKTVQLDPAITQVLTIALPEVDKKTIQARCTLSKDALVAFCSPVAGKDAREILILVSAHAEKASEVKATPGEVTITGGKKKPAEPPK